MEPIERFADAYLTQWERHATVRATKRFALAPDTLVDTLFPETMQALCREPEVVALGPAARRFLLVQSAYRYMNEIALLEVDVVSRLATDVANRPHRVDLSPTVRQVAMTIAVDEAYHAFAAREFTAGVEALTGIAPLELSRRCTLEGAIAATVGEVPESARDDVRLLLLCVAENSITAEIFGLTEETAPNNPFHIVTVEHLVDERRHSAYFQHLLRHYWARLDAGTRETLTLALPGFLARFLEAYDFAGEARVFLAGVRLDAAAIDAIVARIPDPVFPRAQHPMGRNVMRFFERVGILDHPPARAMLLREGWITA